MNTLFFIFAIIFLKIQKDKNISKYLEQFYTSNQVTFNKELNILNKDMNLLEKLLIDKKILQIIQKANKDKISARKELIHIFLPKYKILNKNGFYLIHFHLSDGTSFVRFHKIDKFDDYLLDFRPSIKYVQETKKIFHGFEIGKGIGGFRSVYPLVLDNKVIGSFEISFSINNLIDYMFSKQHIAMVVKKDLIDKLVFNKTKHKFKKCKLNENYYALGNACDLFKSNFHINFDKKISIIENIVVFSYPISDINGKKSGYLLSVFPIKELKVINELEKNFNMMIIGIVILYFIILFIIIAIYYYLQLKINSETDNLTQILNRTGCQNRLKFIKNYILLIIDIDHFKDVNDTYGHDKGDFVLSELSKLLKGNVRKDDIVCRWGGEEFLVILPYTELEDAIKVAEKLRTLIENYDFNGLKLTISIGIALFNGNFEQAFKIADNNLYKAKNTGRNKVVY